MHTWKRTWDWTSWDPKPSNRSTRRLHMAADCFAIRSPVTRPLTLSCFGGVLPRCSPRETCAWLCVEHHARACDFIGLIRRRLWLRQIAVADKLRRFKREQRMSLMGKAQLPSWRIKNGIKKTPDCMSKSRNMRNQKRGRVCSAGTRRTSMGDPLGTPFLH